MTIYLSDWDIGGGFGSGGGSGPGGGSGGGGGGISTADARTIEFGRLLVAVGEGEIKGPVRGAEGLKSIFLNDTAIQNLDDSFNFKGVAVALVSGTNDQVVIPGFPSVESEVSVNVRVQYGTPRTRTISTTGLSAVRIRIACPQLKQISSTDGKESGTAVQIKVERQRTGYNGGAYEEVSLDQNGTLRGQYGSKHTKSFRVELPDVGTGAWTIRVTRLTVDAPDAYTLNETWWDSYTELTDARLAYPNTAVLGVMVDAKQFSSIPQVSADMDLKIVKVPTNYTPAEQDPDTGVWTAAVYATTGPGTTGGIWDGTFKDAFTRNPAWEYRDLAISTRYGAGNYLSAASVDDDQLYIISQLCDEMVDDGHGGTEPRYFCDVYLQGQEEVIKVLDNFASAFRGLNYWSGGKVFAVADVDEDPTAIFTNANVNKKGFIYSGTGKKARHTAAIVSWNDPAAGYRQSFEYVEHPAAIATYGLNVARVAGFGISSQGLAQRFGLWTILSELLAPQAVQFTAGASGAALRPGKIIQIQDNYRAGLARFGGLVASATTTAVTLDSSVTLPAGTNYLKCQMPNGTVEMRTITNGAGAATVITVSSAFSSAPSPEAVWIIQRGAASALFRVLSVRESGPLAFDVSAIAHDPTKMAQVESGVLITNTGGPTAISFPPPQTLNATESLRKQNDKIIVVLQATWLPPTIPTGRPSPQSYTAECRRDSGPWGPMAIDGFSAELKDIDLGTYDVRVWANYTGGVSTPATDNVVVLGKTAPPVDVTNFVAAVTGDLLQSTWDPCSDVDFDHSIIKTPGAGATDADKWAAGTAVEGCDYLSVTTVALARPANGTYDYWIKHVDTSGNESANPTKLTLTVNPLDDYVTPTEKRSWQSEYDRLFAEQSTLDARADAAPVSRTAYDTALAALDTYLNTLTGAQGWTPVAAGTGHWALYTETYYLGTVGSTGAIFYSKFKDVWTARDALVAAIVQASLAPPAATDTFRPKRTWDFSDLDPIGWVPGSITVAAAASPSDKTARKWTTTTSGILGKFTGEPGLIDAVTGSPVAVLFSIVGKEGYILQARVRLVSGTWAGKAYYSTDGTTFTQNCSIASPTVGSWQIVTWDLRNCSTSAADVTAIKGYALELAGSGTSVIEVDYVSIGLYGHGSASEFDLALQAAMNNLLAHGNVTTFASLIVGNVTNLFPNPNSEVLPVSAGGTLSDTAIGAVGIPNSYTGNQYAGARCREIASTTALTVTPRYGATAGDVYYLEAQIGGFAPGTPTITIRPYNSSGGALTTQTLTGTTGGYALKTTQFTLPAGTYSFDLAMHNAGGDGLVKALFDNIILRKAVDGQLLVPGTIQAKHIIAGAIQAYQMSIGPWLQFRANASGLTLLGRPDGSLSRATSSELTGPPALPAENSADAAVYMDDSRSYPSGDVKTFEAQWGGTTEDRGIILNMGSAFATSAQTGLLVIWSGTSLKVCGMTGIGKYPTNTTKTAVTNGSATVTTTSSADDKLTVSYYSTLVPPLAGGTANVRMEVSINGAIVLRLTDADLGSYGGAAQAGYAGLYLAGNVRVLMPRFGRGFITLQNGVITADKIAVDAIIAEKIAANAITAAKLEATLVLASKIRVGYTENGSGYATAGAQLDGTGGTPLKLGPGGMKVGPSGLLMDEVVMRSFNVLDGNGANDSTFRGWTKGNIDTATRSGAPDVSKLTITRRRWDTTNKIGRLEFSLQPAAADNNLDAMRYAKIVLYRQAAAGAAGTQSATAIDTYYLNLNDRLYFNSTDSNTGNAIPITFETNDSGVSSGVPGCVVTLYNVYGPSDTHCFYTNTGNGDSDGTTLVDNGTSNPWSSGGSGGGSGGGGGGGGGGCPGPLVPISTTRGHVLARDIVVGDEVITLADETFAVAIEKVTAVEKVWAEERMRILLTDGREAVFTHNHRVLRAGGAWVEVRDLLPGDALAGTIPGTIESVSRVQGGYVFKITVENAHTYMTEGFLSHNVKILN